MTGKRIVPLAAFCVLVVTLAPKLAVASAFRFKAGITKEQIVAILGDKALARVHDDANTFSTAPSPHPEFESYIISSLPRRAC